MPHVVIQYTPNIDSDILYLRLARAATGDTFHADYGPLGSISFRFV